jgi:hypothetical protein
LAKVNLKIVNPRQPVARRNQQIVHNFINSTAASQYFCSEQLRSDIAEKHQVTLLDQPALKRIELKRAQADGWFAVIVV